MTESTPAYPGEPQDPQEPQEPQATPAEPAPETEQPAPAPEPDPEPDDAATPPIPIEPETPAAAPEAGEPGVLPRAKLMPLTGVVYCLTHNALHEDTTDPHGNGEDACSAREHRSVLYRARKGDADKSVPTDDEESGAASAVAGSVLSSGGGAGSGGLGSDELDLVAGMLADQIRKVVRSKRGLHKLFGDDYNTAEHDERLALLEGAQRKLGDGDGDG